MSFTVVGVSGYALAAAAGVLVYFAVGILLLRQKAWPAKGMPLFALFAVALIVLSILFVLSSFRFLYGKQKAATRPSN